MTAPLVTATAEPPAAADGSAARPDPSAQVERVFAAIHRTRMQGLPFVNEALRVEAIGFRRWEGRWLGVLVTPWFMNLMLLPDAAAAWRPVRCTDSIAYALPAGVFDFIGGHEPLLGDFQSCSLFSPMFEFADAEAARATALAALQALFDPRAQAGGEEPGTRPAPPAGAPAAAAARTPVSKRDFLRGRWLRAAAADEDRPDRSRT
jgi:[NiFe] hydrogenase assembly HybE family chaperone